MKKKLLFWCLPVVSALVMAFSLDYSWSSWLALFGLVPFLVFLARIKSKKSAFWGGWLAGTLFFLINLYWFLGVSSGDWAGVSSFKVSFAGVFLVWLGSALVLGLEFAVFALAFFVCEKTLVFQAGFEREAGMVRAKRESEVRNPERDTLGRAKKAGNTRGFIVNIIFLPSVWILLEYLRSWLFCFWSWGAESSFGPYWTMGNIGYSLVNTPLSVFARYGGLYGLAFLVVFVNVLIFQKRLRTLFIVFIVFIVFVVFVVGEYQPSKMIQADLLQVRSPSLFYYNGLKNLLKKDEIADNSSNLPHLVVFPEGSNLFSVISPDAEFLLDHIFSDSEEGLVLTSTISRHGGSFYNTIVFEDKEGKILRKQDKTFLIPAGEYIPYLLEVALKASGAGQEVEVFGRNRQFKKSKVPEKPFSFAGINIGALSCSGIVSPVFYRRLAKEGAEIFVNLASHSVFSKSKQALFQVETFARFQAIANAHPFLQSARDDYSFAVDANGHFIKKSPTLDNRFVSTKVSVFSGETLYTKLGDWPLALASLFVLFCVCFLLGYNKKYGKEK